MKKLISIGLILYGIIGLLLIGFAFLSFGGTPSNPGVIFPVGHDVWVLLCEIFLPLYASGITIANVEPGIWLWIWSPSFIVLGYFILKIKHL